tara:strand:- start:14731 stop:15114 length:384 start_codon:yes stop_codon:yes gene_type:complete
MKKTDLVSYIKENIRTALSTQNEASEEEVKNQADLNKELEKTKELMSDLNEEDEDVDAPAGDEEVQKKASKNDRIINDFRKIKAKMDTHLAMFKDAEGEKAKNAAKQMLKNSTPEYQAAKKEYDKIK